MLQHEEYKLSQNYAPKHKALTSRKKKVEKVSIVGLGLFTSTAVRRASRAGIVSIHLVGCPQAVLRVPKTIVASLGRRPRPDMYRIFCQNRLLQDVAANLKMVDIDPNRQSGAGCSRMGWCRRRTVAYISAFQILSKRAEQSIFTAAMLGKAGTNVPVRATGN